MSAVKGRIFQGGLQETKSGIAEAIIAFGAGVIQGTGARQLLPLSSASLDTKQVSTLTFDAALVTANVVNGKVNGRSIDAITFATDNNTTMTALAAEIAQHEGVQSVVASDVGSVGYNNTLTITGEPEFVLALTGFVVTAGASQATITPATTTAAAETELLGIALENPVKGRAGAGADAVSTQYDAKEAVTYLTNGVIGITAAATVTKRKKVAFITKQGTGDPAVGSFVDETFAIAADGEMEVVENSRWEESGAASAVLAASFKLV